MKELKWLVLLVTLVLKLQVLEAARIDTLDIPSACNGARHKALVIRPEGYTSSTLILLHGYGGNYLTWSEIEPNLPHLADSLHIAFVMPEGYNSWYLNHERSGQCMTTFIGLELINFLRDSMKLASDSSQCHIAGFSMGGQGALRIAAAYPQQFRSTASMSGSLDFKRSRLRNEILEKYGEDKLLYLDTASVMAQIERLRPFNNAIFIDCGYQDYLYAVSNEFHQKLLAAGIDHVYISRKGKHDAQYWQESLSYVLLFIKLNE